METGKSSVQDTISQNLGIYSIPILKIPAYKHHELGSQLQQTSTVNFGSGNALQVNSHISCLPRSNVLPFLIHF